jgi:glycine hydroxymethyltransferase
MKIAIGSDHRGHEIKEFLKMSLKKKKIKVVDMGTFDRSGSVDYPDFALKVAATVSREEADAGILICGTGIGMSIVANKFFGVRAALVHNNVTAGFARQHNNANVIVLSGNEMSARSANECVDIWLTSKFEGGRHQKRIDKINEIEQNLKTRYNIVDILDDSDHELSRLVQLELKREQDTLILIASENLASKAVLAAQGSVFTNKYAEGYPGRRYYGGCEYCDDMERIAIERAKTLFGCQHANVQPISGSAANLAAYFAVINPGDTVLAMKLAHGGHLTHGSPVSITGKIFNIVSYGVRKEDGLIDYDEVELLALKHKPKLIIAGASSYSRIIDFKRFRKIVDKVKAYFLVDMAHIAGLIAAGVHPSPIPYADVVTSTTHKTLRGPRGGFILCREIFKDKIDKAVFPGLQGGPLMHTILAKAVSFKEAMTKEFADYQKQVVKNARVMSEYFIAKKFRVVSGGTDNHMFLLDLSRSGITGKEAEELLERVGIVVNKNAIPFDEKPPTLTSGIRIGTPSVTTRGMRDAEVRKIAEIIAILLSDPENKTKQKKAAREVLALCGKFPIYSELV